MRYLYADSEPCPLDFPFLPTLERFLAFAGKVLNATERIEAHERELAERSKRVSDSLDALDGCVGSFCEYADSARTDSSEGIVTQFVKDVQLFVERSARELRESSQRELDMFRDETAGTVATLRSEIESALRELLAAGPLVPPIRYRLRLMDGRYRLWATSVLAGKLEVTHCLAANDVWREPFRIANLFGELEIQIGLKKAWLKREPVPQMLPLGDYFLGAAVLEATHAEIHLRKKADSSSSSLAIRLTRRGKQVLADLDRPGENGENVSLPAAPDDIPKLASLWQALLDAGVSALGHVDEVESATLDGADVFEGEHALALIDLFVDSYASIVAEIVRRSRSEREFCLKLEHDDGRREELYLSKDKVSAYFRNVSPAMLERIAPLGLMPPAPTAED